MKTAAPFIAFAVALILVRLQNRGRPRSAGLGTMPPRARLALIAGWLLGFVGIIGGITAKALGAALIAGGLLLVACAWYLRGWTPPRNQPAWVFAAGLTFIGLAWMAVGISDLVDVLG